MFFRIFLIATLFIQVAFGASVPKTLSSSIISKIIQTLPPLVHLIDGNNLVIRSIDGNTEVPLAEIATHDNALGILTERLGKYREQARLWREHFDLGDEDYNLAFDPEFFSKDVSNFLYSQAKAQSTGIHDSSLNFYDDPAPMAKRWGVEKVNVHMEKPDIVPKNLGELMNYFAVNVVNLNQNPVPLDQIRNLTTAYLMARGQQTDIHNNKYETGLVNASPFLGGQLYFIKDKQGNDVRLFHAGSPGAFVMSQEDIPHAATSNPPEGFLADDWGEHVTSQKVETHLASGRGFVEPEDWEPKESTTNLFIGTQSLSEILQENPEHITSDRLTIVSANRSMRRY